MRIPLITLAVVFSCCSCVVLETWQACESLEKGEIRFAYPEDSAPAKFHLPSHCRHLLDMPDSLPWQKCMRVAPVVVE